MGAVKDCPRCGLVNPPSAQRCDCGYDFGARRVLGTYLTEKDQVRLAEDEAANQAGMRATGCLFIGFPGTNLLGTAMLAFAFGVMAVTYDQSPGLSMVSAGVTATALDLGYHLYISRASFWVTSAGGRVLVIPVWVVGLIWLVIGVVQLVTGG